jgi:chloride channel 3/4/5
VSGKNGRSSFCACFFFVLRHINSSRPPSRASPRSLLHSVHMENDDNQSVLSRETSVPDLLEEPRPRNHRRRLSARSQKSYRSQRSQKSHQEPNENTGLLDADFYPRRNYSSVPGTPRPRLSRHQSSALSPRTIRPSGAPSFAQRLTKALSSYDLKNKRDEPFLEDRVWYDQFTSTGG